MQKIFLFVLFLFTLSSCLTNKKLTYFQSDRFSKTTPTLIESDRFEYRLQPNDVLSIKVLNLDPTTSSFFNVEGGSVGGNSPAANLYMNGFSVDEKGFINYPAVGKIQVVNLTIMEAQNLIQLKIDEYLKNATVLVKLISFKVTILGEVRSPGYYYVYNNQASIPEALGLAGDLTQNGNRKEIKLIRQTLKGNEVILLDLTDPNLLKSKYFYLLPNDVIYIQPLRAQLARQNLAPLSFVFSGITTFLALYYAVFRINRPIR